MGRRRQANRFYAMKDPDVFNVPSSYTVIGEGDLYDATENTIQEEENALDALEAALNTCQEDAVNDGDDPAVECR